MRIWIVNHYTYTPEQFSGTRHYNIARELIKEGHDVLIIASSFYHKARKEIRLDKGENYRIIDHDGVPILWLRTPPYEGNSPKRFLNMLVFSWRVWRRQGMKKLERPDAIIGSSPQPFSAFAAERLSRRWGVPFFFEVRDLWPEFIVASGKMTNSHPLIRIMAWLEKYLYRNCERVLSVLPGVSGYLESLGISGDKFEWLPNGVVYSEYPEPTSIVNTDEFNVMYAGIHGEYNNLETVLSAAEIIEQKGYVGKIRITLIGDGPSKQTLINKSAEKNLSIVTFMDPVPKSEIHKVLDKAQAFLMILVKADVFKWGICPNKLVDYMASARPIMFMVSTNYNPIEEAGAGVSVSAGDAEDLAEKIIGLSKKSLDELNTMGQRARDFGRKHHDIGAISRKLLEVINEVLDTPRKLKD